MAIGETILGAVIQIVLEKLISREVINFFHQSKIDLSLVNKLKMLMLATEKLIIDAEEKQTTNQAVKQWLDELKHWFYRAEEVVDDIAAKAQQSSLESPPWPLSCGSKVHNLVHSFDCSSYAKTINRDITGVVSKLESMLSHKDVLGLREVCAGKALQRVPTTSLFEDSRVYGRDKERDRILEFLLSEEPEGSRIGVIAVVGMGGIGKTTLAKFVYNDTRLEEAFDLKVWVCVSDQFDISRVTRSILESVAHKSYSATVDLNFLQNELSNELGEKRFLLVLDDVWNEKYEDWGCLRAPFSVGAKGSKIIVTTRNDGVASIMSTTPTFRLKPMSNDDGWSLFFTHAFEVGSSIPNPSLEYIGRKIVDKCQGLPLAIKTLSGLLRGTREFSEWEAILHSRLWELPHDKSNVIPALRLSYYYLPPQLKRCFSYCAIFPKDYKIDCKQLVLLWMAEDFIVSTQSEKSMEHVADNYVQQLLSRSFLEPLDRSYVTMHDLMHDLAQVVSGDFIARQELESPSDFPERARHFSYYVDFFDGTPKFQAIHKAIYLRTFLQLHQIVEHPLEERYFLTNKVTTALIPHLYYLRVLSLSGYEIFKLPETIGCLKQLRYLDISGTNINQLPESVSTLYNLQTLLLLDCRYLERLVANIGKLALLRHLDIRGTASLLEMPKQMSKLKSLQTLTDFVVGKNSGSGIKELRELGQIRGKFALRRLQNVATPKDAFHANLSERKYINVLALEFDSEDNDDSEKCRQVQLLENLKPPTNLEELTIRNYAGRRFPQWLDPGCAKYIKMTFLCLSGCLYCHSLPPLGQLPSLKQLEIEGMDHVAIVGHDFYGHDDSNPFHFLEGLTFVNMKGWEVWSNVDAKGIVVLFPRLKKLCLRDCPKLKGNLPIHAPLLEELEICGCEELGRVLSQVRTWRMLAAASYRHPVVASAFNVVSITRLRLVGLISLVKLPAEVARLSSLTELMIESCENLKSLANVQLPPKLKLLEIQHCEILESLPDGLRFLAHLDYIVLKQCHCLSWVTGDNLPTSLSILKVYDCERWEFPIPTERMQEYTSLEQLWLHNTANCLVTFPLGIFPNLTMLLLRGCKDLEKVYIPEEDIGNNLTSLYYMEVKCPKLAMVGRETRRVGATVTVLPAPNLRVLRIFGCENIKPVLIETEEEVFLPKLHALTVANIPSEWSPWRSLLRFSCLTKLEICGQHVKHFPDEGLGFGSLPTSLTQLWIVDFPKLRQLDGSALQSLTSLRQLWIAYCPQLQCLPKEGLPPSLGLLSICACPKVENRCQPKKGRGKDWSMIKHLPCVLINDLLLVPDTRGTSVPFFSRSDPYALL